MIAVGRLDLFTCLSTVTEQCRESFLLFWFSHCNVRYSCASKCATVWISWAADRLATRVWRGIQIWVQSEREIKSFVMLSVLCLEAKRPSDVEGRAASRSCSASGGGFFPGQLYITEIYPKQRLQKFWD